MLYITLMCISLCFFADDFLLAVYFIFILDYGNDVRQKSNLSHFLICSKWDGKQQRHLATSAMHLADELLWTRSAVVVQEVLQGRWDPWRWAWWLVIRSWQQRTESIIEADPLSTTWEVAEELSPGHCTVIWC